MLKELHVFSPPQLWLKTALTCFIHFHAYRYLIVIDDIWDTAHWNIIRRALSIENDMGSRILTTTRIVDVAEKVGDGCYRLKPLTNENSEKLFFKRIFGKDKCPEQFYEVSAKILKKCGGVPLAIVTTSSLLANKSEKNIKEWYDVCDSIGLGLERNPDLDCMRNILLLSYYDLPSDLKTCLLYLSIFPEDYKIEKGMLIWRWVAEGFVQLKYEDQSFLECGENYFNELVNRSLIQTADVEGGTPQACYVHDMVLDLIISLSKEECFITTVLGDGKHSLESKQVRRLSLHGDTADWPSMNMPKLRSLTIFKPIDLVIGPMPSLSFHLLRVLDLGGKKLRDLASLGFLGSLSHLRYLGLSTCTRRRGTDQLPQEIGKLQFLQTLDLSGTKVRELPSRSLAGLTQLMCLRGSKIFPTIVPDGLWENSTSLEALESVCIRAERFGEELGNLTRLRALDVRVQVPKDEQSWEACGEAIAECLGKLHKIESLYVESYHDEFVMDGSVEPPLDNLHRLCIYSIKTLPTWINGASLPALSYLYLSVWDERREDIQILGTLPCLRYLTLIHVEPAEQKQLVRSEVGPGAFPSAISCHFRGGNDVQGVLPSMFLAGAMPRLEDYMFRLNRGDFLRGSLMKDLALAHLPSLRTVHVTLGNSWPMRFFGEKERTIVREKLEHEAASHPNHPQISIE
jgi:disease resistance protein RPM1